MRVICAAIAALFAFAVITSLTHRTTHQPVAPTTSTHTQP